MTPSEVFVDLVTGHLPEGWLDPATMTRDGAFHRPSFALAFASARRRCGDGMLTLAGEPRARAAAAGLAWLFAALTLERAGRVALLVTADRMLDAEAMVDLADGCFRRGDNSERAAVLRALSLLREPSRYVELAAQACRTHVQTVFEALACDNPFPAALLPDPAFHQLVLKALFTGASLRRILGLPARVTPELTRMARDYERERRAAGRPVPADIGELG